MQIYLVKTSYFSPEKKGERAIVGFHDSRWLDDASVLEFVYFQEFRETLKPEEFRETALGFFVSQMLNAMVSNSEFIYRLARRPPTTATVRCGRCSERRTCSPPRLRPPRCSSRSALALEATLAAPLLMLVPFTLAAALVASGKSRWGGGGAEPRSGACAITIGNGERTSFWHDKWLNGKAPKELAPDLFRLAWRKNGTVAMGLTEGRWKRGLQRLSTTEEVDQYVQLWIQQTQLTDQRDDIVWRFTANGCYSAQSAYLIQFAGSFADHDWQRVWKAKAENKCKFFCWLLLQNKLWTADRIISKGGQANPICTLCRSTTETAAHMVASCSYSNHVWAALATSMDLAQLPGTSYRRIKRWWDDMLGPRQHQNAASRAQAIIYITWNLWKERCRRVFDNKALPADQLVTVIRQDLQAWQTVHHIWE
ncbi:hypothetical protein EJB05_51684, partial [Eragrostis curvula]